MGKKCFKCGSTNVVKVVSGNAAFIPEVKEELIAGKAVMGCGCGGSASTGLQRCMDCGFEWDYYYERAMEQKE